MKKTSFSKKPQSSPLRKVAGPLLATALAASAPACMMDVVGVEEVEPEGAPDGGQNDAGTAEPEAVGEPATEPEFVGEPPAEPSVGVPPEDADAGEPGIDG